MNHDQLMKCARQHRVKNIYSNEDDFTLCQCSHDLIYILKKLLPEHTFSLRKYLTFRGCRNLSSRDIHTTEYLFIVR